MVLLLFHRPERSPAREAPSRAGVSTGGRSARGRVGPPTPDPGDRLSSLTVGWGVGPWHCGSKMRKRCRRFWDRLGLKWRSEMPSRRSRTFVSSEGLLGETSSKAVERASAAQVIRDGGPEDILPLRPGSGQPLDRRPSRFASFGGTLLIGHLGSPRMARA